MREDVAVRERIERFQPKPHYAKRELCIAKEAWQKVAAAGIKRRLVFAHPDLLKAMPEASLHYRGIALLSRKRVQEIAGSVDTWERSPEKARVSEEKVLKVSRLYNAVISAILLDSADWTLDDGYRTSWQLSASPRMEQCATSSGRRRSKRSRIASSIG